MSDTKQLDPYQVTGSTWLASGAINGRAVLGDDPGLGKSAQAVQAMDMLNLKRAIVICPAAVKSVWPYEFETWGRLERRVQPITHDVHFGAWLDGKFDVAVMSYEYAKKIKQYLGGKRIPNLIIDESHYLKTPTSARTRRIYGGDCNGLGGLIGEADQAMLLTGTPMMNTALDIWSTLRVTEATRLRATHFERQYFSLEWEGGKAVPRVLPSRVPELRAIASLSILRRNKSLLNLPPMRTVLLPIDGDQSEVLALLKEFPGLEAAIVKAVNQGSLSFLDAQHIGTLRRLTATAKAPGFANYLVEQFKHGNLTETFVCGFHTQALNIIADALRDAGIKVGMLVGSTPDTERAQVVANFQSGKIDCIVGNVITAGTGHTLTRASTMYMFETDWVPMQNVQCLARIHRKGQKRGCVAHFVSLSNSVDQRVTDAVRRKVKDILLIDPTALDQAVFA
jgi:SWI/SNF-related matrix-associated actin-dependent regulator of chromatin subfamily A-like protein 1